MKTIQIAIAVGIFAVSIWNTNEFTSPSRAQSMLSDTLKKDAESGLYEDPNLYMVKAMCSNCHATTLIAQHRFTRQGWIEKIRWMQTNHNLWELGEAEPVILDYLEKYYAPATIISRRAPLTDIKWYKLKE
ncbi:hypothetical protein [Dyadobacter tibetensis]|uniref:hypothetical protein n=1 Tax=Dyadobacter tibetensis TaxID=1211851 RepID=UPI00047078E3|nr:hypothetical protein [Dyadobacter tibetensis]